MGDGKVALKLIETGDDMTNGLKKMVDLLRTCFRILHRCIKQEFEKSHKEEWKWLSYLCVNQNDWMETRAWFKERGRHFKDQDPIHFTMELCRGRMKRIRDDEDKRGGWTPHLSNQAYLLNTQYCWRIAKLAANALPEHKMLVMEEIDGELAQIAWRIEKFELDG